MINDLLDELEKKGINCYAFADDLVNLMNGKKKLNMTIRIVNE